MMSDQLQPDSFLGMVTPDVVGLFLFGAATWNPHRIHYDASYAQSEGYRGLVVPGPLQAAYFDAWASNRFPSAAIRRMEYRHTAIAYVGQSLTIGGEIAAEGMVESSGTLRCNLAVTLPGGDSATIGEIDIAT